MCSAKPVPNLRRIRREVEAQRLEQVKKAHGELKRIAQDELKFFKELFAKPAEDEVEKNTQ